MREAITGYANVSSGDEDALKVAAVSGRVLEPSLLELSLLSFLLPPLSSQKTREFESPRRKFTHGIISVGIDASSFGFQLYESGIYVDDDCKNTPKALDHVCLPACA